MKKKDFFVGRLNEQEWFRITMEKLKKADKDTPPYANTLLVYGVGGMGKSYLCRRFEQIVQTEYPEAAPIFVDWDRCKNRGSTMTPEELVDAVAEGLNACFPKELKGYWGAKKDIHKEQEKISRLLEQKRQSLGPVAGAVGEVAGTAAGGTIVGSMVTEGVKLLGKGLSAMDERTLRERAGVSDDRLRLYKDPASALARRLLDCIGRVTGKKGRPVVLFLDTCELLARWEDWFTSRFLAPLVEENRRLVLIFSGRHNPYDQRAVEQDGKAREIRGMGDLMAYPPQRMDMALFSKGEIADYLHKMNGMGGKGSDEAVVELVRKVSRGVPYAVDLLTGALRSLGPGELLERFGDPDFETELREAASNEDVIRKVARRFILYCLGDQGNKQDLERILTYAVLNDADGEVLKALWQVEKPSEVLRELEARYALFIGKNKLHDVVREFLKDYLLEDKVLRGELPPAMERVLKIYKRRYEELNGKLTDWDERVEERRWTDTLVKYMTALTWLEPDNAVDFFLQRGIELFLWSPSLVEELREPLDRFMTLEGAVLGKNRKRINRLSSALEDFSWYSVSKKREERMNRVLSFCGEALSQWSLEPVHHSVLRLIEGRCRYHLKDNDGAYDNLRRVEENPGEKTLRHKWAEVLNDLGERFSLGENNRFFFSPRALELFEKAVNLNGESNKYWYHLGVMTRLSDDPIKALPYYLNSIKLDDTSASVFNSLGNLYDDLKDYPKALDMYEKAIALDEKDAYSVNGLGYLHLNQGNYPEAIRWFRKSIEIKPQIAMYNNLAIAYFHVEKKTEGIEAFKQGLALIKDGEGIDSHTQLNQITGLLGLEKIAEARALLDTIPREKIAPADFKDFFFDWNLLASAPRPPKGIEGFIQYAKEKLEYQG